MQNNKDKHQITPWDAETLIDAQKQLFVDISEKEWEIIISKIETRLAGMPEVQNRQQADVEFQKELVDLIKASCPELSEKAELVLAKIKVGYRFCILRGLNFDKLNEKTRDLIILGFSCMVGNPTSTDKVNKVVLWPVKPEKNHAVKNTTFSQRIGEAEYHTDTQYFEKPEKYMSLWCINPDRNGGGVSGLLDGRKILSEIQKRYGTEVIQVLSESLFPFRVPSVFTEHGDDTNPEIYYGPIFNNTNTELPLVRYRRETLEKGLISKGAVLSHSEKYALECIEKVLHDPNLEFKYFLRKGDVIFANNHELLHMRTYFDDMERFLIRVRFN